MSDQLEIVRLFEDGDRALIATDVTELERIYADDHVQYDLFGQFAIVHGSEEDEVEQNGQRFRVRYIDMDVVVKRNRRWQIVGSQLAKY